MGRAQHHFAVAKKEYAALYISGATAALSELTH